MMGFSVIPRSSWTSAPKGGSPIALKQPRTWKHHTAGFRPKPTRAANEAAIRGIRNYHVNVKKWSDLAYSWLEGSDDRIYEGRGAGRSGGHTMGHNSTSYGLCSLGNFQTDVPSSSALNAWRAFLDWAHKKGYLGGARSSHPTGGHRDVGQTACPGDKLYAQLGVLRTPASAGVRFQVRVADGEWGHAAAKPRTVRKRVRKRLLDHRGEGFRRKRQGRTWSQGTFSLGEVLDWLTVKLRKAEAGDAFRIRAEATGQVIIIRAVAS